MLNISKNEKLNSYLKDKRVCYIGPSPYMIGRKLGEYIDSFDIICRVNNFTPINYKEDYGSRTDILFNVFNDINSEYIFFRKEIEDNPILYDELKLCVGCWDSSGCFGKDIEDLYHIYINGLEEKDFTKISKEDYSLI